MNSRIVTATWLACVFGGFLLVSKTAMAQGKDPFESFKHHPTWELAVTLKEEVKASQELGKKAVTDLLKKFSDLQKAHDAIIGGTAPICQEVRNYQTEVEKQRTDAIAQQKAADDLQAEIDATPPKQRTKAWAQGMEARRSAVNGWAAKVDKRGEQLDNEGRDLNRKIKAMLKEWVGQLNEFSRDAELVLGNGKPVGNPQARLGVLRNLKEPPAITPDQASLSFLTDGSDEKTQLILLSTEVGVATLRIMGTLAGKAWAPKVVIATGKAFIAMEDAADVYLMKQNETYETALKLLKGKDTRQEFSEIVRALRHGEPLKPASPPEMIAAARAILDPKLGNSGTRIAWSAMWSPEAKRAGLTQVLIEVGGEALGQEVERVTDELLKIRGPTYAYAAESWRNAEKALATVTDSADRAAWEEIRMEAGRVMEKCFTAPASAYAKGLGESIDLFAKEMLEKAHKKQEKRYAP